MATAAKLNDIGREEPTGLPFSSLHKPPLNLGERVVWLGNDKPEHGTVWWMGHLPEIAHEWSAGVELDNPVGGIDGCWNGKRLFKCKPCHGILISINGLIKENDFLGNGVENVDTPVPYDVRRVEDIPDTIAADESVARSSFHQQGLQCESTSTQSDRRKGPSSSPPLTENDTDSDDSSGSGDFDVDRLAVNRLLKQLEVAISCGRLEEAATRARDLAQLKIQCSVVQNRKPKGDNQPNPVILNMFVEDKVSHHGPIPIKILPSSSVLELKKKIFRDFEFPMTLQRWILGKKLALDDQATLSSFGVDSDGCPIFLYLLTPDDVQIKSEDLVWENEDDAVNDPRRAKKKPVPHRPKREKRVCRRKSPALVKEETSDRATSTTERSSSTVTAGNDDCDTTHLGWQCVQCTLFNAPFQPVCSMCGAPRPKTYVIPSNYVIPNEVAERLELEKKQEQALKEAEELRRLQNWQQYLQLDDQDVIYNTEPFECSICYIEASPGEGVQLRDCLHLFCCDCLRNAIAHCEEAAVKCPYRDDLYSCDSVLQEREIRALVPADVYERYLQRSMTTAESQAKNSFHCKTPDCPGWCIFEDNANEFACPICGHLNCITCRAIHEQLNCRQYQDKLMVLARTDEEAKKTRDAIEVMLQKGDAMRCPSCEVIIMKKWGCDWLCCSVCKTEICWVTKGPRWGPKGRGDISGGCKCGTAGVRCHPKCNYCH